MKCIFKEIFYKLLVTSMITILLSFFCASSFVNAKITLEDGEFYYSGTQEADITWEATFWQRLVNGLKDIANYLIGILLLAMRATVIGWMEIAEITLSALLGVYPNWSDYFQKSLAGIDTYSQNVVNVQRIIFNDVKILDADIFNYNKEELEKDEGNLTDEEKEQDNEAVIGVGEYQKVLVIVKKTVAKWYIILRLIAIAIMLIILIFVGIKMAISTIASEKAMYKQMFLDWVVGMALIFFIHYFMIAMITINNNIVEKIRTTELVRVTTKQPYEYGSRDRDQLLGEDNERDPKQLEIRLYETARTRAYSLSPLEGISGTIIYGVLIYYAWKFTLIYFRRMLNIMLLTIVSPIVAATYAFNKVASGGARIFSNWLKEYFMNVFIQLFHVIVYITMLSTALRLSLVSLAGSVVALVLMGFMSKSEQILRQLFNITGGTGSIFEEMAGKTSFKQLRANARKIKSMAFGGAIGMKFLKVGGRVATMPVRKVGELGFGTAMKLKANSSSYKDKKRKEEEKIEKKFEEYNESTGVNEKRNELESKEEKLYQRKGELKTEKEKIKTELAQAIDDGDLGKIQSLTDLLKAKEEEENQLNIDIQNNKKEIDEFEESVQQEFLDYYVRTQSTWDAIKSNISNVFDPENYLDKNELTFGEIEEKAEEMFPEFDKYKEIVNNGGARTEKEQKLFEEYSMLKDYLDLVNDNEQIDKDLKLLKDKKQHASDPDEIKKLSKQISEYESLLAKNNKEIERLKSQNDYVEYLVDNTYSNAVALRQNGDYLLAKMEERKRELEGLLGDEIYDDEFTRASRIQEAEEKLEEMRVKAKNSLTKYTMKKTTREGGANLALWKKKTSGVGKIFMDNAKLDKILGISGDEKKILKEEYSDAKSMVTGTVSGIAGFAIVGVNPALGMILMANNLNSRANNFLKRREFKNSPSKLKYNFKFKAFGEGSMANITEQMQREIKFAESKLTKKNAKSHPKLTRKLLSATEVIARPLVIAGNTFSGIFLGVSAGEGMFGYAASNLFEKQTIDSSIPKSHYKRKVIGVSAVAEGKLDDIYQAKVRKAINKAQKELINLNIDDVEKEYQDEFAKYKKKIREEVEGLSYSELLEDEIMASDDSIKVGDTVISFSDSDILDVNFGRTSNDVTFGEKEERQIRIKETENLVRDNKDKFLESAIYDYTMAKKIDDVSNLTLTQLDRMSIKDRIKERYERKGRLKRGELKIGKIISDADIDEKLRKMKLDRKNTNDKIADKMVETACFGFMSENGITDPNQLNSADVTEEIKKMMGESLLTEDSKKTANVINQLNNGNNPVQPQLPDTLSNMEERIEKATQKMEKQPFKHVEIRLKNSVSRKELVQRSIMRRENEARARLQSAVYTEDDTQVTDEAELKMLFLLSEMSKINRMAYKVEGKKSKKTKEETLFEMRLEQSRLHPDSFMSEYDYTTMPRDEELNILLHGKKDIIDIINS